MVRVEQIVMVRVEQIGRVGRVITVIGGGDECRERRLIEGEEDNGGGEVVVG